MGEEKWDDEEDWSQWEEEEDWESEESWEDWEDEETMEDEEMTVDSLYAEFISNVNEYCPTMYDDANEWADQQDQDSDLDELRQAGE